MNRSMAAMAGSGSVVTFDTSTLITSIVAVLALSAVTFAVRIYAYRTSFAKVQGSLKQLPYSMWFGSLTTLADMYKTSPTDAHPHGTMTLLHRKYNLGDIFYVDLWPFVAQRQIVISDPAIASQAVQTHNLEKHPDLIMYVGHLCGPRSMLYSEGARWKKSRSIFNPGFSASHLMTLVPGITTDCEVFVRILRGYADKGDVVCIENAAARLTIDIMGHVVLDHDLNAQTTENALVAAFREATYWTRSYSGANPFANLNPVPPVMRRITARRMEKYLDKVLMDRFKSRGMSANIEMSSSSNAGKGRGRPVIDLALNEYIKIQSNPAKSNPDELDNDFKSDAIDQMKTFIFAGHDTSSSTISYIYYILGYHQEALQKLRDEHDEVFGKNLAEVADMIRADPQLVNKLPYTNAVIKETLRLFPPATTIRKGDDTPLVVNGEKFSTKNHMIWINGHAIHRRADLWPNPDAFIPERFLPAATDGTPVYQEIAKDSFRPFEKGPRGCIGQELAMLEMRVIVALTAREFDIRGDYETYDVRMGREKPGDMLGGTRGMFGYRAYQVLKASAKPSDSMPVRVKRRVIV